MIRNILVPVTRNDNGPNLLFVRRWLCLSNCDCCNWVLHVLLPLTSYDLYSQILCVYESSIEISSFFVFFFVFFLCVCACVRACVCVCVCVCGFFYFRTRGNLLIYRKMYISRLLWGDQWKLHGEIQRHAIMTTYMFMKNDRREDSFV